MHATNNSASVGTKPGSAGGPGQRSSGASIDPVNADAVVKVVRDMMATEHLRAVLLRVTISGDRSLPRLRRPTLRRRSSRTVAYCSDSSGSGCSGVDDPGFDRSGFDGAVVGRAGADRSGVDCSGVARLGVDC
jgi:hypothetical protein